jgi:uncharacterized protein (TIGR02996 family)
MSENTARGFLDDIISHPEDDTPRLIYADWLEDHGQLARAEFIRLQIERARLPHWDARQVRLRLRERALIEEHGRKWREELGTIKGITWGEFRRGFTASAGFGSFAVFETSAEACWTQAPIEAVSVRWPRQSDVKETVAPIECLRELTITGKLVNQDDAVRLANLPLLSTLRALTIPDAGLGMEGFRRLTHSPFLGNLTALRVPYNSLGNGSISNLIGSVSLTALEDLDLSEKGSYGRYGEDPIIDAPGLELLARWPGLARLRCLTLSGNEVGKDGLRALLRSPHVVGLKTLHLRGNGLHGSALQEFRNATAGLQLDVLDLGENLLRELGADNLAKSPCLRELKVLGLDRCELRQPAIRKLAEAPFLASLRRLNLNANMIGREGLAALLDRKPAELHTLTLVFNHLGDEGLAVLAGSPASNTLVELDLTQNTLGIKSAQALLASTHLQNLAILRLKDNPLSKRARVALAESPLGKRLAVLEVTERTDDEEIPLRDADDNIPF